MTRASTMRELLFSARRDEAETREAESFERELARVRRAEALRASRPMSPASFGALPSFLFSFSFSRSLSL